MEKLFSIIKLLIQQKFTGTIQIHFCNGGVAKVNKSYEEINING